MAKEETKEYQKIYYENNKEKIKERHKEYRENNKEKRKKYIENNIENSKEYQKKWYKNNIEKRQEYIENNKNKIKNRHLNYLNNRRKIDTLFKLSTNLRNRIYKCIKNKNYIKSKRTFDMLGCDLHTAKAHLEKQFTKGMTWENQGEWHIDHIIPCASAKTEEELIKLFHYTNLQPLWAADNLSKGSKIIEKQLFLI